MVDYNSINTGGGLGGLAHDPTIIFNAVAAILAVGFILFILWSIYMLLNN